MPSATAPSSRSGGPCSSSGSAPTRDRQYLQVESSSERHQGRERGIRLLSGEETTDRLRLHSGPPGEFRLGEMKFPAPSVEGANHGIDLLDSLAGLLIGLPVLRILQATSEVALCSCPCRCHVVQRNRNVYVTHVHLVDPVDPSLKSLPASALHADDHSSRFCLAHGADQQAVEWLDGVITKAGWRGGRLAAGASDANTLPG